MFCCGSHKYDGIDTTGDEDSEYDLIKNACLKSGFLYEDPDFKPETMNLEAMNLKDIEGISGLTWRRPRDIHPQPVFINDGATYDDIDQQVLGDCWFLSALSTLLYKQPKHIIARLLPRDQNFGQQYCGAFHFRFWEGSEWQDVIIDDRLLTDTKSGKLIFTNNDTQPDEFWMPLLEKAFAKLKGGFHEIEGGRASEAFTNLTGDSVFELDLTKTEDKNLFRSECELYDKLNILMTADSKQNYKDAKGLQTAHSYSVLDTKRVNTQNGEKTLVHLRNPWGKTEWEGDWGDSSPLWKTVLEPNFNQEDVDDGCFWMELDHFFENFKAVSVVLLKRNPQNAISKGWYMHQRLGRRDPNHVTRRWKRLDKPLPKASKGTSTSAMSNPQFELVVNNKENSSVYVFIEEWDSNAVQKGTLTMPIVVKRVGDNKTEAVEPKCVSCKTKQTKSRDTKSGLTQYRLSCSPNEKYVICCFMQPDIQSEFFLRVYSQYDFSLRNIEKPIKCKN